MVVSISVPSARLARACSNQYRPVPRDDAVCIMQPRAPGPGLKCRVPRVSAGFVVHYRAHALPVKCKQVNMADVKSGANLLFLREEELRQGIELLYYAYRDFTAEPDAMLARYGFGRAHHRVIYFVGRHPQMSVTDLLGILRITKQTLTPVLAHLVPPPSIRP